MRLNRLGRNAGAQEKKEAARAAALEVMRKGQGKDGDGWSDEDAGEAIECHCHCLLAHTNTMDGAEEGGGEEGGGGRTQAQGPSPNGRVVAGAEFRAARAAQVRKPGCGSRRPSTKRCAFKAARASSKQASGFRLALRWVLAC